MSVNIPTPPRISVPTLTPSFQPSPNVLPQQMGGPTSITLQPSLPVNNNFSLPDINYSIGLKKAKSNSKINLNFLFKVTGLIVIFSLLFWAFIIYRQKEKEKEKEEKEQQQRRLRQLNQIYARKQRVLRY